MSYREEGQTIFNKDSKINGQLDVIVDPQRVLNALETLSDTLKNLNGIMSTMEVAATPDFTPEFLPSRDASKLPTLPQFSNTAYSNAVIIFDSLEFGPADANTVYQNDYTIEVTAGEGEIFSVPFTAELANIDARQQLDLKVTSGQTPAIWWLSVQPGGKTLSLNSFIGDRALGGRIEDSNLIYTIRSYDSTSDTGNTSLYVTEGEIIPTGSYWLNFTAAPSTGVFDTAGRLLPNIEICPGSRETVILVQGDTVSYEVV